MDGSSAFALLVALTYHVGLCHGQPFPSQLPPTCSSPAPPLVWWRPLIVDGSDPCQLQQQLTKANINTVCCAVGSFSPQPCGPCNEETYNIAMACTLCSDFSRSIALSTAPPGVPQWLARLAQFSNFENGAKNTSSATLPLPIKVVPWMNTEPSENLFNAEQVVEAAQPAALSQTNTSPLSTSVTIPTGTNAGPLSKPISGSTVSASTATSASASGIGSNNPEGRTSVMKGPPALGTPSTAVISMATSVSPDISAPNSTSQAPQASSKSNAGAIAGGVIGGVIALALIMLAVFYVYRRRKTAKIPASAKFMTIAQGNSRDNSPPPFTRGGWNGPLSEKVTTTAELQNEYNERRFRN